MTIPTSIVVIQVAHDRTMLGSINIIASHREYLQNTGEMGEIVPYLRAAFVALHLGFANLYVRA